MPPRIVRSRPEPPPDGFEAQTIKPATDGFEAKPSNLRHVSPPDLDRPSCQVVRAPSSACAPVISTRSTRSLHALLRSSMYQVSATTACHPAIWSVSPSLMSALHRSQSISTARPPWPSPRRRLPDPQLGTCTTRTKKHVASTHRSVPVNIAEATVQKK